MNHQIESFQNGTSSIRNLKTNECMHSSIGAWQEAHQIYVDQSPLKTHFDFNSSEPIIIYDIGLGIGANALAAIELILQYSPQRTIQIISFENDLEGLELALTQIEQFPFLKPYKSMIQKLLAHDWVQIDTHPNVTLHWELKKGDFRETVGSCPRADLIFFDLFSPKSSPDLWNYSTFECLYQKSKRSELGTTLITYSASTSARAALLYAGYFVGYGVSTHGKKETTIASTLAHCLSNPLDDRWLSHWKRSSQPIPKDLSHHPLKEIEMKLIAKVKGLDS